MNDLTGLLDEDRFPLQNTLKTHDFVGTTVNFVSQEHRSMLHRFDDRTFLKDRFAIHKAKATQEIILIGLGRDLKADEFTTSSRGGLLDHEGFSVSRKTRDKNWEETAMGDDRLDVLVVTPGNEEGILLRNKDRVINRASDAISFALFGCFRGNCLRHLYFGSDARAFRKNLWRSGDFRRGAFLH